MTRLLLDSASIELIKKELVKENAPAMRIFTRGGCCNRFEILPVKKALAGDVTFMQGGVKIYVERELVGSASQIKIKFNEQKGLIIELLDKTNL